MSANENCNDSRNYCMKHQHCIGYLIFLLSNTKDIRILTVQLTYINIFFNKNAFILLQTLLLSSRAVYYFGSWLLFLLCNIQF